MHSRKRPLGDALHAFVVPLVLMHWLLPMLPAAAAFCGATPAAAAAAVVLPTRPAISVPSGSVRLVEGPGMAAGYAMALSDCSGMLASTAASVVQPLVTGAAAAAAAASALLASSSARQQRTRMPVRCR